MDTQAELTAVVDEGATQTVDGGETGASTEASLETPSEAQPEVQEPAVQANE